MGDKKSCFITLEGSEGAGKTSGMVFIKQWLTDHGHEVTVTREPGGTILGEHIRALFLNPKKNEEIDGLAELLLLFAARSQHIRRLIEPSLLAGKIVLCDRFTETTWAYQGGGRQLNREWIAQLEQMVQGNLRPDIIFFLDIPVHIGLDRVRRRGGTLDRLEQEKVDFFERVRETYLQRAKKLAQRYTVIDATCSIEDVHQMLSAKLSEYFE